LHWWAGIRASAILSESVDHLDHDTASQWRRKHFPDAGTHDIDEASGD
jgi:hypothetical protein